LLDLPEEIHSVEEESEMGVMRKQMLGQQRASFEQTLRERLSFLSGKGIPSSKADKDTIVRKLKADIRAVNNRLRTIADNEKRTEEMARIKAERAATPKDREAGKSDKPKKAPEGGKGKKTKPEGGKSPKPAEPASS
jgi:hypothetical protein